VEIKEKYVWQLRFMEIHTLDFWINVQQDLTQILEWQWLRQLNVQVKDQQFSQPIQ